MFRREWKERLGNNIRRTRRTRGMTQETAAEAFRCTLRHWQRLEAGTENPSLVVIVRIARALGTTPARLVATSRPSRSRRP